MKIIKTIILVLLFGFLLNSFVYGEDIKNASPSSGMSSSKSSEDKEIKQFKERVEQAIVPKYQKKAFSGKIKDIKDTTFNIETVRKNDPVKEFRYDKSLLKIYRISGSSRNEAKMSDVKEDSYVFVVGSEVDKSLEANTIYMDERFTTVSGKITEVNKTDYYLKVLSISKEDYIIDIETSTKQTMLNIKSLETEKIGFSKIKEGDTIHIVFSENDRQQTKDNMERVTAKKILIIPQEYFIK